MKESLIPIIKSSTRLYEAATESFVKALSTRTVQQYRSREFSGSKKQIPPKFDTIEKNNNYNNNKNSRDTILVASSIGIASTIVAKKIHDESKQKADLSNRPNDVLNISRYDTDTLKKYYLEKTSIKGVSSKKTREINSEFSKAIDLKDEKPLIYDIMQTIAKERVLNKINLYSEPQLIKTRSGLNMLTGSLDGINNNINVYDANNRPTKEIISSIVHEASHLLQNLTIENRLFNKNPFKNLTLVETLKKDQRLNPDSEVISEMVEDIKEYDRNRYGFEIHSRVMEKYYEDTEETKKLFPNKDLCINH